MLKIKKTKQGAPIVNNGWIRIDGEYIVALCIDLKSKYCDVSATSSGIFPGIVISTTGQSLHLHKKKTGDTWIEFPQYAGWDVWCSNIQRYTLSICLIKEE